MTDTDVLVSTTYYFNAASFKEACDGLDVVDAARRLFATGRLIKDVDGKHFANKVTLPRGAGRARMYRVVVQA